MYKDGRPNGQGSMFYKNSLGSTDSFNYELAKYDGNFSNGRREGKGSMTWGDGTVITGTWRNDMRHKGTLIMNNGLVYIGSFKNDKICSENAKLLLPNFTIFEG